MTTSDALPNSEGYAEILADYLRNHGEDALYRLSLLTETFIESGLGPEDIIALHVESLDEAMKGLSHREQARAMSDGHQFLLDAMIAYGVRFKEYLELRLRQSLRDAEARMAEEQARALDAERVGRQKDELLKVIAHEIRTPLSAAAGHVDYARRLLSRGQLDRLPTLLDTARQALDRLSRMSADLVEASRGSPPMLRPTRIDLRQVGEQACAWAEASAEAQGVHIRYTPGPEPLQIMADADAMLSVFGNLLSNAIRYSPTGGDVVVRCSAAGERACASVQDGGIGMPEEVQARIFEKFYRAPAARGVETRGLGLGLSLVQQIVQAHQGQIEVESAEGRGSTFRVYLPLVAEELQRSADGSSE
jgi:signal transduction histidine kinase